MRRNDAAERWLDLVDRKSFGNWMRENGRKWFNTSHLLFRAGCEVMGKFELEQSCLLAWKRSQI